MIETTGWTEPRGLAVNTSDSYSGGPGFKYVPRHRLYRLKFFSWFFLFPPVKFRDSTLKLSHDWFLPNPFQFIFIHFSYHLRNIV
jgi:hypothetical protein